MVQCSLFVLKVPLSTNQPSPRLHKGLPCWNCSAFSKICTLTVLFWLHCTLSLVVQCIVIGPVCLWVCYHDNLKLRASIFTKLGL